VYGLILVCKGYTFLSQIFDYGNTAVEKWAIFSERLLRLLDFDRERPRIDRSKVVLTHRRLKSQGRRPMPLNEGGAPTLDPFNEAGSRAVREKTETYMRELIEQLNALFGAETTDRGQFAPVNLVIKGKLLESAMLRQQAKNNMISLTLL
jgi:type I restriction enzyme R subunit